MVAQNEQVLSHHGIVNMKWGVRNGPPYPLARRSDGSLNRQKQDSRKRNALGNMPIDELNELRKQAASGGDEHTAAIIKSVESSKQQSMAKAEKAKENFEARSREKLGDSIKSQLQAAKAARIERREQKQREKEAARETEKRLAEEKAAAAAADEKEALKQYIRHNPTSIYKYADAFTNEEMRDLIDRIDLDRQIKNVRDQEIYRYKEYLEKGASAIKTLANASSDTLRLYEDCKDVWNAVGEYKQNKDIADGKEIKKPFTPLPTIKRNNNGDKSKESFTKKHPDSVKDNDAAEQQARNKKDKKNKNSNQNNPNSQKPKNNQAADKPFPSKDNIRSVLNTGSKDTVDSFWNDINEIRSAKIDSGKWTTEDAADWSEVMDAYYKYQQRSASHSAIAESGEHLAHAEEDPKYGLPELKKYPMPDREHVLSAIRFFNYVSPKNEEELAKAILARIEEYGMELDDIGVGEKNRFSKYLPQHLEHHGIKGQRWGIRRFQNLDGTLTEEGRERYGLGGIFSMKKKEQEKGSVDKTQANVHRIIAAANYYEDISDKIFNAVGADKSALNEARNELQKGLEVDREITKEMDRIFEDMNGPNELPYWEAVSELASYNYFKDPDDFTVGDLCDAAYMGIFEDGQQSSINAYSMYAYKNHLEPELEKLYSKVDQVNEYRKNASDIIQKALNEAGGENLTISPNNHKTGILGNIVANRLADAEYEDWKDTNGRYYLNSSAEYATNFKDADKSAIAKAEKIVSHLNGNKDESTWYLLAEATDNLGMRDKNASELTQHDWDLLNAEIRKLSADLKN